MSKDQTRFDTMLEHCKPVGITLLLTDIYRLQTLMDLNPTPGLGHIYSLIHYTTKGMYFKYTEYIQLILKRSHGLVVSCPKVVLEEARVLTPWVKILKRHESV